MRRCASAALALCLAVTPAAADEFTDVVEGALEAYRDGDRELAREELDFAMKLLGEMKAAGLVEFLPPPLPGWTRQIEDAATAGAAGFAMMGGGSAASASYLRGTEEFSISIMADSPVVSGMAAMLSGMSSLGGGRTVRIQRVQFTVSDGEMQGVVGGRTLVQVSGSAATEDKEAHLEAMDLRGLADF